MRLQPALTTLAALLALASPLAAQQRVVSIGGAVTEIVFALGQEGRLVARDTTSTYPHAAQALPDLGYMRALSPEGVLSANPDLILLEEGAGPPETLEALASAGIPMVLIGETFTAEGVPQRVEQVAEALGIPAEGTALAETLRQDLDAAIAEAAAPPAANNPRPRVLFILSNSGGRLMGAGEDTAAAAMIALAGGQNAVGGFTGYKPLGDEAIAAAAPDIVLTMARGEGARARAAGDPAEYLTHPALAQTPAGQEGRLISLPGMFLLGFGPRTPEAVRTLHRALQEAMEAN